MNGWGMHLAPHARKQIWIACSLVLLSGLGWMMLDWNIDAEDFMTPLRLWQHRLLVAHGISAYALLWVLGRLFGTHQLGNWRAQRNRRSGLSLSIAMLLLAMSGLTLYYPPHEDFRHWFGLFHQTLGLALILLLPLHIVFARRERHMRRAASHASH